MEKFGEPLQTKSDVSHTRAVKGKDSRPAKKVDQTGTNKSVNHTEPEEVVKFCTKFRIKVLWFDCRN